MTAVLIRAKQGDRRPLPAIAVVETNYTEPRHVPECYYLNAIHPDKPSTSHRLMVLMENQWENDEVLIDLSTNATGFLEVIAAVRTHSKFQDRRWAFVESWEPEGDEPF